MNGWEEKLSAYLDDELPEDEAAEIAALIESDPEVAAAFEALCATQDQITAAFDGMKDDPVPFQLAQTIQSAPEPEVTARPGRALMFAACAAFAETEIGTDNHVCQP